MAECNGWCFLIGCCQTPVCLWRRDIVCLCADLEGWWHVQMWRVTLHWPEVEPTVFLLCTPAVRCWIVKGLMDAYYIAVKSVVATAQEYTSKSIEDWSCTHIWPLSTSLEWIVRRTVQHQQVFGAAYGGLLFTKVMNLYFLDNYNSQSQQGSVTC